MSLSHRTANRTRNSFLITRLSPRGIKAVFLVAPLVTLCILTTATAQNTGPITTQGIPPFSLESNAGGGIDSINLGNLGILLNIPINSNGVYGPKASASLMMESGFPLVLSNSQLLIGFYIPFHLQPLSFPQAVSVNQSSCKGNTNGVTDSTGAYHPTSSVSVASCNTIYLSNPGRDGWQTAMEVQLVNGYYIGSWWSIAPDGTYTALAEGQPQSNQVQNLGDLHGNKMSWALNGTEGAWSSLMRDAAGNETFSETDFAVMSGGSTIAIEPSSVSYPGPGGTSPTYTFGWNV